MNAISTCGATPVFADVDRDIEQRAVAVLASAPPLLPAAVLAIPRVLRDALDKVRHRLAPPVRHELFGPLRAVEEEVRRG